MADNVDIDTGTGATVATDDVGGVQFQKMKLDLGGNGATLDLTAYAASGLTAETPLLPTPTLYFDGTTGRYRAVSGQVLADGITPGSLPLNASVLYGQNGSGYDRLQVDGNKYLKVVLPTAPDVGQTRGPWAVSGTLSVNPHAVWITGPAAISGTVSIGNTPDVNQTGGPWAVSGIVTIVAGNRISTANSYSSTGMASLDFFAGAYEEVTNYAAVTVFVRTNQAGSMIFYWSNTGVEDAQYNSESFNYQVGDPGFFSARVKARYFRLSYFNSIFQQNSFRLQTLLQTMGPPDVGLYPDSSQNIESPPLGRVAMWWDGDKVRAVTTTKPLPTNALYFESTTGLYRAPSGQVLADGLTLSSAPIGAQALYGYNGATYDRLQVDGNKYLKVVLPTAPDVGQTRGPWAVSGTVTVNPLAVWITGPAAVSGTVSIGNVPDVKQAGGPWAVSGTVSVGTPTVNQGTSPWVVGGSAASGTAATGNPVRIGMVTAGGIVQDLQADLNRNLKVALGAVPDVNQTGGPWAVSGTVTVNPLAVWITGPAAVSGTVTVNPLAVWITGPAAVSGTVSVGNTVTVDSELPAAAALSDTVANPTTPTVGAASLLYDQPTNVWQRARSLNVSGHLTAPGLPAVAGVFFDYGVGSYRASSGAVLADGMGNPVVEQVGAHLLIWNNTDAVWGRWPTVKGLADTIAGATVPAVGTWAFNGTTWDRVRTDGAKGLMVGGSAASGVAATGNPVRVGIVTAGGILQDLLSDNNRNLMVALGRTPDVNQTGAPWTVSGTVSTNPHAVWITGPAAVSGTVTINTPGTLGVSGTLSVNPHAVWITGPAAVSGTVSVNPLAVWITGPAAVSGTVSIGNSPDVNQTGGPWAVSGTVASMREVGTTVLPGQSQPLTSNANGALYVTDPSLKKSISELTSLAFKASQPWTQVRAWTAAHGMEPPFSGIGQTTRQICTPQGVPFVIGGHPNVKCVRANYTAAQTNAVLVSNTPGTRIVVTRVVLTLDKDTTPNVTAVVGLAALTTPTTTNVVASHPGIDPGGGMVTGDGSGMLAVGNDGDQLLVTADAPTAGSLDVIVSYYLTPA